MAIAHKRRRVLHSRLRRSLLLSFLLLVSVATTVSCSKPSVTAPATRPSIQFITIDGRPLGPAQYANTALLVNFWSSSCAVCLKEMPLLQAIHSDNAQQDLTVVAVAMPYDRPSDAVELRDLNRWSFTVAIDPDSTAVRTFGGVKATPTTVLYNRKGQLVWVHVGELDGKTLTRHLRTALMH